MAIRAKLVIIFFLFILVPMFLLWARWQGTAIGSIKSVLRQGLADRVREISDQISASLETHKSRLNDLTTHPALISYARTVTQKPQAGPDPKLQLDLSAFLLAHQNQYFSLIIINRQGAPIYKIEVPDNRSGQLRPVYYDSTTGFSSEDLVPDSQIIANTTAGSMFVSDILQNQNGVQINVSAPLKDDAGNVTAGIVLKLRAVQLISEAVGPRVVLPQNLPKNQSVSTRAQVIIISQDGTVVYATDQSKEWKPYTEAFSSIERELTPLRSEKDKDKNSDPWLIRHRLREASPKLSIFMIEDYKNAIGQLEFDSYVLLLLTLLLVVVAMLALYYLISTLTDSIRRVTNGAKAIATGNLGYQIKVKSKDETRVLAEAFNRMASRLRDMIRKEGEQKQFESFARLSSVLTHDLKNQILSLSLLVSNMERKFDREGFKEDAMRTLSDSVSNLQNLVAKLSDPRTPTKRIRERSNITHLVERVIQRTAAQAVNRYKVSTDLKPDLFATVDGKAVERVIENLVINALEAMPDGGALRVSTQQENGHVIVAVADTGKGMTAEFRRERLFHPFATTKKKGIGLGLYSCRDIIEQHGGTIDVDSTVDVGTEFRVVLPVIAQESNSGELRPIITV